MIKTILLFIIVFITTNILLAEENESFTAREGYNALINNSELDINSKFDLINISTAKNYSTEEREYFNDSIKKWIFRFKSKDTLDNYVYTYTVTLPNGIYSYELQKIEGVDAQSFEKLNNDWLDSDKLIIELKKNVLLSGYFYDNKNSISSMTIQLTNYSDNRWIAGIYIYYPFGAYCSYNSINFELKFCDIPSSVMDLFEESNIYPNPAKDFIEISLNNEASFIGSEVQIFNMLGIEVLNVGIGLDLSSQRIDVSHLPYGVYYIKIGDKVEKFVKM